MSITLLYCDEFAFVRNSIAREFWTSISPTLATGGKAIITSTPNSDEDQFWLLWRGANRTQDEFGNEREVGENGFKGFMAKWHRHPDRDETWAVQERASIGEERFRREHECEPVIYDETLIAAIHLMELDGREPLEKQGQVRWYKRPESGQQYVIALDPSLGTGGDPSAIQVIEIPSLTQVAEWKHNQTVIQRQIAIVKEIAEYIFSVTGSESDIYYSVENNTLGEAALVSIAEVGEENIRGTFLSEPARAGNVRRFRKGFNTTHKPKLSACAKLKTLIESGRLTLYSKPLIGELKTFVAHGMSFAAKPGETDDLVMSLVLSLRMIQMLQGFDSALDDRLRDNLDNYIEPMPFIMI
jgi:hypothetical protein